MNIYLDINKFGAVTAYPLELPGCYAWGEDEASAMAALPGMIEAYSAERSRFGLPITLESPLTFDIVERTSSDKGVKDATFSSGLFEVEKAPISQAGVDELMVLAQHVRGDLMDLLRGVDGNTLDFRPFADVPTIGQIAKHTGGADHWYTTRFMAEDELDTDWDDVEALPLRLFLAEERKRVAVKMSDLSEENRSGVFTCTHTCTRPTEVWTVRKILRRMLVHEREHIAEIRSYFDMMARTC